MMPQACLHLQFSLCLPRSSMRPASGQPVYTRLYRVTQVEVATYPKDDPAAKKRMPNYEDTRYQAGTEVLTFVSDQYFCMRRVQRNADGTPVVNEVPFEEQLQLYPLKQVLLSGTVVTDPEEAAKMVSDTLKLEQRQPRKDGKPIGPFTAASKVTYCPLECRLWPLDHGSTVRNFLRALRDLRDRPVAAELNAGLDEASRLRMTDDTDSETEV